MKRICAYCNTVMSPGHFPGPVSHGICDPCSHNLLSHLGTDVSKYLDMFDAPVILVNHDARILGASCEAAKFMGKPLSEIVDSLAGNALECTYAGLRGECGKEVCCSGCAIRNTVRKTFETGEPVDRCPAVLMQGTPDQPLPINLLITAKKAGSVVLLRIEPVCEGTGVSGK